MTKRLTRTMLEQLETYVDHRDDPDHGGWYYGNREQFEKRHKAIKEWLAAEIAKTNNSKRAWCGYCDGLADHATENCVLPIVN